MNDRLDAIDDLARAKDALNGMAQLVEMGWERSSAATGVMVLLSDTAERVGAVLDRLDPKG
jgi:hypothetical protein